MEPAWHGGGTGHAMGSVCSIGMPVWSAAWTVNQRRGHHLLAGPMVPQNPSQVRGGPKHPSRWSWWLGKPTSGVCVATAKSSPLWWLPLLQMPWTIPTEVQGPGDLHGGTLYLQGHPEAPILRWYPQEWTGAKGRTGLSTLGVAHPRDHSTHSWFVKGLLW